MHWKPLNPPVPTASGTGETPSYGSAPSLGHNLHTQFNLKVSSTPKPPLWLLKGLLHPLPNISLSLNGSRAGDSKAWLWGSRQGHSSTNTGDFQLRDWEGNKWVHFIGCRRVQNYSEEEQC